MTDQPPERRQGAGDTLPLPSLSSGVVSGPRPSKTHSLPVPISPVPAHLTGAFAAVAKPYGAPPAAGPGATVRMTTGAFAAATPTSPTSPGFPAKPTTGGFSAVPAGSRITVLLPEPGTTLASSRGEYLVTAVLGAGEFGAVFDCIGPFDQHYAVKVIRPANRPYAEVQAEWAREASRLMSLRHPNVVYIHDAFEQNALFFLALEKCEHALKDMLGAPMQEGLVLELTRQLLAAVQFLHDNDVVHDDLHAGNVLVTHVTDRPVVKISDFGISHELRGLPAIKPNVVHHAIMAPEILATGYTSKQSDLYQVGLLLYWMVTGTSAIPQGLQYSELCGPSPRESHGNAQKPSGRPSAGSSRRCSGDARRFATPPPGRSGRSCVSFSTWKERQLFPRR